MTPDFRMSICCGNVKGLVKVLSRRRKDAERATVGERVDIDCGIISIHYGRSEQTHYKEHQGNKRNKGNTK